MAIVSNEQVIKVLRQYNPWRRAPSAIQAELGDVMSRFMPLQNHFNRYLMVGGFPELVLSDDDIYAQRMLREDVLSEEEELGIMVETAVYKHMASFYQGSTAQLGYFRKAKNGIPLSSWKDGGRRTEWKAVILIMFQCYAMPYNASNAPNPG